MHNVPILTPEDRAGQPISTSYDHYAAYRTPINTDIDDNNSKYWIKLAQEKCCGRGRLYNLYKGPFPNKEEKIMTLSTGTANNSSPAGDESVSGREEINHAELHYKGYKKSEDRDRYSLRSQQKKLGLIHLYYGKINYHPFFQLVLVSSHHTALTVIFMLVINLVLAAGLVYALASDPEARSDVVLIVFSIILVGVFVIQFCCFCLRPCYRKDAVSRLHTSNLEDITTGELVAKVYNLRGICLTHGNDLEIICHRELSIPQLMGLFSLAILSLDRKFFLTKG